MSDPELAALRETIRAARPPMERRVYVLACTTVERVLRHAAAAGLPSEVAAAGALLGEALDDWEGREARRAAMHEAEVGAAHEPEGMHDAG